MSFQERRKVIVINVAGFLGGTSSLVMFFFNLYNGLLVLALLNIVTVVAGYCVILFHATRFHKAAPLVIGFVYSIAAALSAILYHNNVEYFLLLYIGVYFIVLENMAMIILFSLFNVALFLAISFGFFQVNLFPPVSETHRQLVILNGMTLFIFFLYYFKRQSQLYRQEIEKRNRELDILNRNKEKLFSIIAHDIKSPVGNMLAILQMIYDGQLTSQELEQMSGTLLQQVTETHENINTILHWSKTQLSGLEVRPQQVGLLPLVHKVAAFMQSQAQLKLLHIDMDAVEDVTVWIDPDHLEIIIRNLLSNAIKFSFTEGVIHIFTRQQQDTVELVVKDEGKGISAENILLLSDQLSFFSTSGTANEKGTGLGLKLCQEFITKNGGKLHFTSKEGEGSEFMITIPLQT